MAQNGLLVLATRQAQLTYSMLQTSQQAYNMNGLDLLGLKVIKVSIQEEHGI